MTIETPRLALESITPSLAKRIIDRDERTGDAWHPAYPFADELGPLASLAASDAPDPVFSMFLVRRRADGLAVGGLGFFGPPDATGTVAFGFGLVQDARGEGLATEAVRAALKHAAAQGARRAIADAELTNGASRRVLAKAGLHETRRTGSLVWFERDLTAG